ncbi:uncharacterized protein LOC126810904 [Patella vulgata]|uniref:uncharacterized protein LOC126810904 n=1 Tax=Patella vulgata TaxID=6465 RepID=UPI0021804309|nr:uncharacterized protein LOC126810904 [Patella vulgata]
MDVSIIVLLLTILLILSRIHGNSCPDNNNAPLVNMCSNEVKTGSRLYLDINIKPGDNITNCSCILQLIQPDHTKSDYLVNFDPKNSQSNWCIYDFTVANVGSRGQYNCADRGDLLIFHVNPNQTTHLLLQKINLQNTDFTGCIEVQSVSKINFSISCESRVEYIESPTDSVGTDITVFPTTDSSTIKYDRTSTEIPKSSLNIETINGLSITTPVSSESHGASLSQVDVVIIVVLSITVVIVIIYIITMCICKLKTKEQRNDKHLETPISAINPGFSQTGANFQDNDEDEFDTLGDNGSNRVASENGVNLIYAIPTKSGNIENSNRFFDADHVSIHPVKPESLEVQPTAAIATDRGREGDLLY